MQCGCLPPPTPNALKAVLPPSPCEGALPTGCTLTWLARAANRAETRHAWHYPLRLLGTKPPPGPGVEGGAKGCPLLPPPPPCAAGQPHVQQPVPGPISPVPRTSIANPTVHSEDRSLGKVVAALSGREPGIHTYTPPEG